MSRRRRDDASVTFARDRRDRLKAMDRVVREINRLGQVSLPSQDAESLIDYQDTYQAIVDQRAQLTRIQSRLVLATKTLKAQVAGASAEIKIFIDEMMVSDVEVKRRGSREAKLALARYKLAPQFAELSSLKTRLATAQALLEVCIMADKNLIVAKESMGKVVHVTEMNLVTQGRIPQVRLGRSGLSQ